MLFHAGDITVGLTSVSPLPMIRTVAGKKKNKSNGAYARKRMVMVWECSACKTKMPLGDPSGPPPKRCSNRVTCGKMFRNV